MFHQHNCPACGSTNLVKNGSTHYRKVRRLGKRCGRQFVEYRQYEPLSNECKRRIELLLAERISLEAICRVMEIKPHQLYAYMDELYDEIPADLACSVPEKVAIELIKVDCETDELCRAAGAELCRLESQQAVVLASLGSGKSSSSRAVCGQPQCGWGDGFVAGSP